MNTPEAGQRGALRDKRFVVFAVIAAVLLLVLIGEVVVTQKRVAALSAERAKARATVRELDQELSSGNTDEWRARNTTLEAQLHSIDREVPRPDFVAQLTEQVNRAAQDTGNVVEELRIGERKEGYVVSAAGEEEGDTEAGQRYDTMDVDATLVGSFQGAFDFLRRLGALGKIVSVEEMQITARDVVGADQQIVANIRLKLRTYILEPRPRFPGQLTINLY